MFPGLEAHHLLSNPAIDGTDAAQGYSRTPTVCSSFLVEGEQLKGRKVHASSLANSHLRLVISRSTRGVGSAGISP